jgi:hypothetical protein
MPPKIRVLEAVRLAKEALGDVPAQKMADRIASTFSMTVQPVVVTIMLGSLLEKEIIERSRLKAIELIEQAKAEKAAEKPRGQKKKAKPAEKPADSDQPPQLVVVRQIDDAKAAFAQHAFDAVAPDPLGLFGGNLVHLDRRGRYRRIKVVHGPFPSSQGLRQHGGLYMLGGGLAIGGRGPVRLDGDQQSLFGRTGQRTTPPRPAGKQRFCTETTCSPTAMPQPAGMRTGHGRAEGAEQPLEDGEDGRVGSSDLSIGCRDCSIRLAKKRRNNFAVFPDEKINPAIAIPSPTNLLASALADDSP